MNNINKKITGTCLDYLKTIIFKMIKKRANVI